MWVIRMFDISNSREFYQKLLEDFDDFMGVPVVNQIRTYWWCNPPKIGRQRMYPAR
jgi:hypothetical protein